MSAPKSEPSPLDAELDQLRALVAEQSRLVQRTLQNKSDQVVQGASELPASAGTPYYRCKVMTVADYLGITNPGEDYRPLFVPSATDYTEFDVPTVRGTIETSYDNTVSVTMAEISWLNPGGAYDFDMFIHDGGTLTGQYQIHFNGQFSIYDTLITGPSRVTYRAKPDRNYLCIIRDAVPFGISIQMRAFRPEWWAPIPDVKVGL